MGDALQPKDKPKEKKKKKSVVKLSDLPIKPKPEDELFELEEEIREATELANPEIIEAPAAPKKKKSSVKKSEESIKENGKPENEQGGETPAKIDEPPKKKKSTVKLSDLPIKVRPEDDYSDEEPTAEPDEEAVVKPVPPEAQNGGDEFEHHEVEATPADDHDETPKRRESEAEKKGQKKDFLKELDEEKLIELKELFELLDLNQDGFIDFNDLKLTFVSLGKEDVTDEEVKTMLSEAANPMDFDAFVMLLGFKSISLDPEETLRRALSSWDYRDTGFISEEGIKHDLMTRGDRFDINEAEGAFEDAPIFITNGQRMIDYIKFCKTLGGLRKSEV